MSRQRQPHQSGTADRENFPALLEAAKSEAARVDLAQIDPPISPGPWSLAPDTLKFVVGLVRLLKPRHILEFGSGLSTRVLGWAISHLRPACHLSSVDHDPDYGKEAAASLDAQFARRVRFQIAPLVARQCMGRALPVYDLRPARFASKRPADLFVADGPPMVLGGREGTLFQAMNYARSGTLFLLDDAARPGERQAVARWKAMLGEAIEVAQLEDLEKGLAAVLVCEAVPWDALWAHHLKILNREIAGATGSSDTVILVDENYFGASAASDRRVLPFLERDGQYWGAPDDDQTAIQELERMRASGARSVVFAWPAFWCLDHYSGFKTYLHSNYRVALENDRLVAFDLRART